MLEQRFSVAVFSDSPGSLFPSDRGGVKALTPDFPRPPYPMVSYTLAVFVGGTAPWSHHSRHADQHAKICLTLPSRQTVILLSGERWTVRICRTSSQSAPE